MHRRQGMPVRGGPGGKINAVDRKLLDEAVTALLGIINGHDCAPIELAADHCDEKTKEFIQTFNLFLERYQELTDFVLALSMGNLDTGSPKGRMKALQSLKGMHSNLRHLTWQTKRVAEGDYNQQVDFMGDFSAAFNKMTLQLKESFRKIESQNSALADANRFLEEMNKTDALTGLGNRRAFDGVLSAEWRQAERQKTSLSLILMDVDCFKKYNDGYGHGAGDECLRQVATAIRRHAKRPHDLAARYGGEEFAVILCATSAQGALAVAEEIRKDVEGLGLKHEFSAVTGMVTISAGTATAQPGAGQTFDSLIERADKALYAAKNGGRNRVESAPQ